MTVSSFRLTITRQAESPPADHQGQQAYSGPDANMAEGDLRALICDLQARRIELEKQNEELLSLQKRAVELAAKNKELQEAQRRAETYRDRYIDLYDYAPLGYVTLDEDGYIQEINLAGHAKLLGCEAAMRLSGYEFADYVVTAADRRVFLDHVRKCCA